MTKVQGLASFLLVLDLVLMKEAELAAGEGLEAFTVDDMASEESKDLEEAPALIGKEELSIDIISGILLAQVQIVIYQEAGDRTFRKFTVRPDTTRRLRFEFIFGHFIDIDNAIETNGTKVSVVLDLISIIKSNDVQASSLTEGPCQDRHERCFQWRFVAWTRH